MSRLVAYLLVLVVMTLTITGFSSTGSAMAATASDPVDSPVVTGDRIVKYTDADGNVKTKFVQGGGPSKSVPKVTQTNPGFDFGALPVLLSKFPTAAVAKCIAERVVTPIATAMCKALYRTTSGGNGAGVEDKQVAFPQGFIPKPGLGATVNGCPECVGGFYDPSAGVWYSNPGEKYGFEKAIVISGVDTDTRVTSVLKYWIPDAVRSADMILHPHCTNKNYFRTLISRSVSLNPGRGIYVGRDGAAGVYRNGIIENTLAAAGSAERLACIAAGGTFYVHLSYPYEGKTLNIGAAFEKDPGVSNPGGGSGNIRTLLDCVNAAGEVAKVVKELKATGVTAGATVPVPDATCPGKSYAIKIDVDYQPEGGTGAPQKIIDSADSAPAPGLPPAGDDAAIDCYNGTVACLLEVRKSSGENCGPNAIYCAEWAKDGNAAGNYKCTYGGKDVSLNKCSPLRAPQVGPLPGTDKDGNEIPFTAPVPAEFDNEIPESEAGQIGGSGNSADGEGQKCFPTGWAVLNPVEWVMKPVGCAMTTAFVPRGNMVTEELAKLGAAIEGSYPGKLVAVTNSLSFTAPPSRCDGITVSVFFLGPPFKIMNACPGQPLADLAYWSRIFGNVTFSVYGAVAITRHIARIFEYEGLGGTA